MVFHTQSLGSCLVTLTLLFFAGSAAAEDVSSGCEAAIDRAAGNYSRCLLSAQSRNARRPDASRLEGAEQRCTDRFDSATARALARAEQRQETCTPFLAEIADRTATYAEGVATEASGEPALSLLFVQNATGGTLSESTLTLTGVSSETGWFSDRPYQYAGQIPTEVFISFWGEGEGSYADDPPNADFTCKSGEPEIEQVNYVVELTDPSFENGNLSYSVAAVGDTVLPQTEIICESESHLFIDSHSCSAVPSGSGCYCLPTLHAGVQCVVAPCMCVRNGECIFDSDAYLCL